MKEYIKNNKIILLKYLYIIISNILIYILTSYYLRNIENNFLVTFFIVIISNIIILNYKQKIKCIYYLDFISCVIIGIILNFFIKTDLTYSTIIFTIFFANTISFNRTRNEEKILKKLLQYLLVILTTIFSMFISLAIRLYL